MPARRMVIVVQIRKTPGKNSFPPPPLCWGGKGNIYSGHRRAGIIGSHFARRAIPCPRADWTHARLKLDCGLLRKKAGAKS